MCDRPALSVRINEESSAIAPELILRLLLPHRPSLHCALVKVVRLIDVEIEGGADSSCGVAHAFINVVDKEVGVSDTQS